jgi:hypothetical protein
VNGFKQGFNPLALTDADWVPAASKFINLDQKGLRLQEVTGNMEYITLAQLFSNPGLMSKCSIILLGGNETTGFGKTTIAKSLAASYVMWQVSQGGCSREAAFVHVSSTIDSLKDRTILPGQCLLLDEFSPCDVSQNRNLSPEALKVLLDTKNLGSIWTRFGDTIIPPGARIFTANHTTPQSWVGERFDWTAPMQRKSFCFIITKPLLQATAQAAAPAIATTSAAQGLGVLGFLRRATYW